MNQNQDKLNGFLSTIAVESDSIFASNNYHAKNIGDPNLRTGIEYIPPSFVGIYLTRESAIDGFSYPFLEDRYTSIVNSGVIVDQCRHNWVDYLPTETIYKGFQNTYLATNDVALVNSSITIDNVQSNLTGYLSTGSIYAFENSCLANIDVTFVNSTVIMDQIQPHTASIYMPVEPIYKSFKNPYLPEINLLDSLITVPEEYFTSLFKFEPSYAYNDLHIILSANPKYYNKSSGSTLLRILTRKSKLVYLNSLIFTFYKTFSHRFIDTIKPLLGLSINPNNTNHIHLKDNSKFNLKFQF